MTTAFDVPALPLLQRIATHLQSEGKVTPPEWAPFARTGVHTEKAPVQRDWWYLRAAANAQARENALAQRQLILRQILTPEARERLGRIELAYPELTESIESQLIALAQSGRVQRVIDDETLRQILTRLIPKKREIKIERR